MMTAVPQVSPEAVAHHAACPLRIYADATLALLADAEAARDPALVALIEADLLAACHSIATAASPALRHGLADLLHHLPATATHTMATIPHNEQPPRG